MERVRSKDGTTIAFDRLGDGSAFIAEGGGTASVYGHYSGAGLALHAAAHDLPIAKLVLHEPPYVPDDEEERRTSQEYAENLKSLLAQGRRGDAVELFMTNGRDAAGGDRSVAQRAVVGRDGGDSAHARLRFRGHGPQPQGRHDTGRLGRQGAARRSRPEWRGEPRVDD